MRPRLLSFELAWTDAAFDAIFPAPPADRDRPALVHGVADLGPARWFDRVLSKVPFEQWLGLRLTLWMVALAPLFTIKRLGTIASITPAERMRVLERLIASPIYVVRQLTTGLKAVATMLYAQSKAIRTQMATPIGQAREPGAFARDPEGEALVTLRTKRAGTESGDTSETRVKLEAEAKKGEAHEHAAE